MDTPGQEERSLLLVEDNRTILDSLRDWLSMTFPDVHLMEAESHSSGIYLSRSESPDVVLMDISNLGKNGVESVKAMKTSQPGAAVFALVSLEHASYRRAIIGAGAEACACIWKLRSELLPQLKAHLLPGEEGMPGQ
jgi:DNA-binding NarL/FixJ family response regulator